MPFHPLRRCLDCALLLGIAWLLIPFVQHPLRGAEDAASIPSTAPAEVTPVERHLFIAQKFCDMERYGLAFSHYEQVLALDPNNVAAHSGEERVRLVLEKYGYYEQWTHLYESSIDGAQLYRNAKLHSLIIPSVEWRSTPLSEAIKFLREESLRVDTDPDPKTRGVMIVIDPASFRQPPVTDSQFAPIPGLPEEATPSSTPALATAPHPVTTALTMQLKQVPLLEAVKYTAVQAGLRVILHKDGIHLAGYDGSMYNDLPTAEFDLTPEVLGILPSPQSQDFVDAVIIRRRNPKAWLEAHGMMFPPGSSAAYRPETHKLIIRNSSFEIDELAVLLNL